MIETFPNTRKVNIIIVNYNSWEDLLTCIKTVNNSIYSNYQIFIVDNDSQDISIEKIKASSLEEKKTLVSININDFLNNSFINQIDNCEVVLVINNENEGFGAGNNVALKYLVNNRDDEYVWLLNPDTEVEKNVLSDLVEITQPKRKIITGNLIHYFNDRDRIMYCGGFKVKKYIHGIKRITNYKYKDQLSAIAGASLFTQLSSFKDLGLLPEEYFMYWEETDFCTKALKNGYSFEVNCKSKIYDHVGSASNSNFIREYLYLLNGLRYYRKYYNSHLFFILLSSLLKFLKALIFTNKVKLKALFWAHLDFCKILLGKEINIKERIAYNKANEERIAYNKANV